MRELGATKVEAYGIAVEWHSFGQPAASKYSTSIALLKKEADTDDDDGADEVDGTPMAVGPEAEAWLAQKLKQETQTDTRAAPQPDLMDWYTARPLPSVD